MKKIMGKAVEIVSSSLPAAGRQVSRKKIEILWK
jgi:hypothetical protein